MKPVMLPAHRRFLILDQGVYSVLSNALINGAIAWAVNRKLESMPFSGDPGLVLNAVLMALLLPLLVCLIVTPLVARKVRSGALPPLPSVAWQAGASVGLARRSTGLRALVLGMGGVGLVAAPILALWALLGPSQLSLSGFVLFTALFAGLLAALATPLTAWWAMLNASSAAS